MRETITTEDGRTLLIEGDFTIEEPLEQGSEHELDWGQDDDDVVAYVGRVQLQVRVNGRPIVYINRDGWELEPLIPYTGMPGGLADELQDLGFEWDETAVEHSEQFEDY